MERESFIFYRSFYEAVDSLPLENQARIYKAIASYALNGEIIKLNQWENALFKTIRPQLDANQKRFENGCKGAEYGKLGGAPKGNQNARKNPKTTPKQPQDNPKTTPNVNDNVNVNDNESKEESVKEEKTTSLAVQSPAAHTIKSERFTRPTLEEVAAYCAERGNSVDPQRFIDYYTSKGWKVGNAPMKDWRAAVRTWERKDGTGAGQRRKQQGDPMLECLQRLYAEAEEEERRNAENDGD